MAQASDDPERVLGFRVLEFFGREVLYAGTGSRAAALPKVLPKREKILTLARRTNSEVWHEVREFSNGVHKLKCRGGIIEEEAVLSTNMQGKLCPTCFPGSAQPPRRSTTTSAPRRRM